MFSLRYSLPVFKYTLHTAISKSPSYGVLVHSILMHREQDVFDDVGRMSAGVCFFAHIQCIDFTVSINMLTKLVTYYYVRFRFQ